MANKSVILLSMLLLASAAAVCLSEATIPSEPSSDGGIQRALSSLAAGRYEQAERIASVVVAGESESDWRAWLIVAAARHRLEKYANATEAYKQFLSLCQSSSERAYVMEQIARCRLARGKLARPVAVPKPLSARKRAKLSAVSKRKFTESSEHFVVRSHNSELAKLVVKRAEIALGRICRTILAGQDYPHSVNIYVWPDVAQYRKHAVSAPEWSGGGFSLHHDKNGQMVRRIDLTQTGKDGRFDVDMLDRVLPHEMCHLVLAEFFGDAPCPLALNEGLAMMAEAGVDNSRVLMAGMAMLGSGKIPLRKLLMTERCNAGNAAVFYAESFSLTAYLHKRMTPGQFREMLTHIKTGCPMEEAIQRALYMPIDETFLKRLSTAWEAETLRQWQFLNALN